MQRWKDPVPSLRKTHSRGAGQGPMAPMLKQNKGACVELQKDIAIQGDRLGTGCVGALYW